MRVIEVLLRNLREYDEPDMAASVDGVDIAVAVCDRPMELDSWVFVGLITRLHVRPRFDRARQGSAIREAWKKFIVSELIARRRLEGAA